MPLELLLTLVAVFLSVALISGSLTALVLAHNAPGRRRLRNLFDGKVGALLKGQNSLIPSLTPAIQRLATLHPEVAQGDVALQKRMAQAGYHGLTPALVYTASELITAVIFGGTLSFCSRAAKIALTILAAMIGYVVPGMVLRRRRTSEEDRSRTVFRTRSICSSSASRPVPPSIRPFSRRARTSTCRIRRWLRNCG